MQHYCSHPCRHPLNFLTSSVHKLSNYTINTEVHWLHVFAVVQVRIRSGKHNDKLQKSVHPSIFLTASHTCDKVKGAVQWTFHHSVAGQESNMSNKSKLSLNIVWWWQENQQRILDLTCLDRTQPWLLPQFSPWHSVCLLTWAVPSRFFRGK